MALTGWDVGGAHLKAARVEDGCVTRAVEVACPLWQGMDKLAAAFATARQAVGETPLHAVTMTGELSDLFANRAAGVARLCEAISATLPGEVRIYAGSRGWLSAAEAPAHPDSVASANWHATAALAARQAQHGLLVDMGSTTTDIIPLADGCVAARGSTDAERLATGELFYTGVSRSFVMAVARRVPFRGGWTPLMSEYFASMADVHRILGDLPDEADHLPAADNGEKTAAASCVRLARMIGRDAGEADAGEWHALAAFLAEAQLRSVHDAALQVLSHAPIPADAPVIAAGAGRFVVARLAARLGRRCEAWSGHIAVRPEAATLAGICAPAAAVGLLLAAQTAA